jgi:hypothetical protein
MKRTLIDQVETIHLALIDDETYRALLSATSNAEAIEGSLLDDDTLAASMIRDHAKKIGDIAVAREKLADIITALRAVMRRYGMSRRQRRDMVGDLVGRCHKSPTW